MVRIESLEKFYGRTRILKLSPRVFDAGVHFVVGPNGSGKTTFFKCLAGLHPFQGKVFFQDNIDISKERTAMRRLVAYCAAEPIYPDYLTGRELLDFVLSARQLAKGAENEIVDALKMGSFLEAKTGSYSSGMKKKLGLLLAMVGQTPLLILDEPYAALDQPSRRALAELIDQGVKKGQTVLIASHLADLHAAFGHGKTYVVQDGDLKELGEHEKAYWLESAPAGEEEHV